MGNRVSQSSTERADPKGRTPLHYAAAESSGADVRKLLTSGANPNVQDSNGWSPLHFAAQANSAECTAELLRHGADHSLRDTHGNTALFRAVFASGGDGAVIGLLLNAGADPLATNGSGVSPASLARTIANYDVAQYFVGIGGERSAS
jgi:uncharacterized protein